jgi:hypothetical protein
MKAANATFTACGISQKLEVFDKEFVEIWFNTVLPSVSVDVI